MTLGYACVRWSGVSFCGRVHERADAPSEEKHRKRYSPVAIVKRGAKGKEREREERERERERECALCPNHAIVWPLIVDSPPAGRVEDDGNDETHR